MSDTVVAEARRPRARKDGRKVTRRVVDTTALADYLAGLDLGVTPTIHVNGHAFQMALVTVDFGQPLKPIKLSAEQHSEFTDRLRKLGRDILNRGENANIRVSHDLTGGLVYFASAA